MADTELYASDNSRPKAGDITSRKLPFI